MSTSTGIFTVTVLNTTDHLKDAIHSAEAARRELVNNFTGAGRHIRIAEIDTILSRLRLLLFTMEQAAE